MKFVADEGVEDLIVEGIRAAGHDVIYVMEAMRGAEDDVILKLAKEDNRILITRDKDFGELVYLLGKLHSGIILNRLAGLKADKKVALVLEVLGTFADDLYGSFTVIQADNVRIRKMKQ